MADYRNYRLNHHLFITVAFYSSYWLPLSEWNGGVRRWSGLSYLTSIPRVGKIVNEAIKELSVITNRATVVSVQLYVSLLL